MKYGELSLGQIEAIVNKLGGMKGVKHFLSGNAEVVTKSHVIDCDADPYIPAGWKVEEHRKGGQIVWDTSRIILHLADDQKNRVIGGNKLRTALVNQPTLNANVLDYLLSNPHLIPEEWKGKYVFFWTIYRHPDNLPCVRFLHWDVRGWYWGHLWLDCGWDNDCPVVLRAS